MIEMFIALAELTHATTYGFGEKRCGNVDSPTTCSSGAITASGDSFDPQALTVAVPTPKWLQIRRTNISLKDYRGNCFKVVVNDKKHWRFIGKSGMDVTPAVQERLTGKKAHKYWKGKVSLCKK